MNEKYFITCDPGSVGTGFALFQDDSIFPLKTWLFEAISAQNWEANRRYILYRCNELFKTLDEKYIVDTKLPIIYIEEPYFSEIGVNLTAARSGSLVKLATTYGGIRALAEANGYTTRALAIPKWKGQLDKRKVHQRIQRHLGKTFSEHVADAVGMGIYLIKGKL